MLVLKGNATLNAKSTALSFYDLTGGSTQTGGWNNGSNPDTTDATSAILEIYAPNSTTLFLNPTLFDTVDMYSDMPSANKLVPYTITAASVGLTTFLDGEYMFKYIVVASGDTYTKTFTKIFSNQACCCTQSAQADMELCGCEENKSLNTANELSAMMRSVERLAACYQNKKAVNMLKAIKRICDNGCLPCR